MAGRGLEQIVRYLNRIASDDRGGELTDAELLERYASTRDAAAFEVLVWRHGEMVFTVCLRLTRRLQDAEDSFQATFLALARKAYSIGKRASVASWLYKVAFRSSLEARRRAGQLQQDSTPVVLERSSPLEEAIGRELQEALNEEVIHLPEKYRSAIILSCFQGKTNRQIAVQLRCPEATVRTRLARGRERLRTRLDQRGLQVSSSALGLALTAHAGQRVTATLVSSAIDLASGSLVNGAGSAVWIARKVERLMFLQMIKPIAALVVVIAGMGGLTAYSAHSVMAAKSTGLQQQAEPKRLADRANSATGDHNSLIGTWERSATATRFINERGKPPFNAEVQVTVRWVITLDHIFSIGEDGFVDEEFAYKLDTTKDPRTIDLVSPRFGTLPGIYRVEGNSLWVSYGFRSERPTKFINTPEAPFPVFHRVSSEPAQVSHHYPNPPGCFWMIAPSNPSVLTATMGFTFMTDTDKDGAVVITVAHAASATDKKRDYRPVLFDAAEQRYLPKMESGGSSASPAGSLVSLQRWRMDPKILPKASFAYVGIEAVTEQSTWQVARTALDRAKQLGMEVLPWPMVGNEYPLALTTVDGRKLGRNELKGKVVVVDCWASWCSPCMAKMSGLKRMYEKSHGDGLEIIGVNLDNDLAILQRICKTQGMTWPQVQAPTEAQARETWRQALGLESVPRILLIDRNGKLRADTPADLEGEIARLLREGKK